MKPLIVLILVFAISLLVNKIFRSDYYFALSARIAIAVMLLFTAIAHFTFTEGMAMMLPDFIPLKRETVYFTGFIEILLAIGILLPNFKLTVAWLLIVFFILILPANIYAAFKHIDYQKATLDGNGLSYLWFRIPLQLFYILWVYFSSIKN